MRIVVKVNFLGSGLHIDIMLVQCQYAWYGVGSAYRDLVCPWYWISDQYQYGMERLIQCGCMHWYDKLDCNSIWLYYWSSITYVHQPLPLFGLKPIKKILLKTFLVAVVGLTAISALRQDSVKGPSKCNLTYRNLVSNPNIGKGSPPATRFTYTLLQVSKHTLNHLGLCFFPFFY